MPSFSDPYWLLLLPAGGYFLWWIQKHSFADSGPTLSRTWLVIRVSAFALVVLSLAGLRLERDVDRKQVIFVTDVSESVRPEQREQALGWINSALAGIRPADQVGVVVFGMDAAVERFPSRPRPVEKIESSVEGSATDIENGMRLASALFADGYRKNMVLLTDGAENQGDAAKFVQDLRRQGVSLQTLHMAGTHGAEAQVESVRIPEQVSLKQRFNLRVVVSGNEDNAALLQIYQNGSLVQETDVGLEGGEKEVLDIPEQISVPGIYHFEARLRPVRDDRLENNSADAWLTVEGPPAILLVDDDPAGLSHLADALRKRGFAVTLKQTVEFPFTLQEMMLYRAIFVRNVPAQSIQRQMPLLKQYVHDLGGGFAMLGGERSFGPGGYYHTPVEELLPVTMDLTNEKYLPTAAMVIVIDKSGSMSFADRGRQKIDLADEGAARVAGMLKIKDQVGVLAVDSVARWAFPLNSLRRRAEAVDAILSIRAGGGGIYVFSGLNEAYSALSKVRASLKHVILFADTADCEEKEGPGGSSITLAAQSFQDHKVTTSAIGIGKKGDVDIEFLRNLALAGRGRFYFTDDMFTLPEIFSQESAVVQRDYVYEKRFTPAFAGFDPILQGISAVPDLLGYVATSAKSQASVPLISPREEPVLASWRYGLGTSAAFTSSPAAGWGWPWLQWPEFDRFWSQFARALAGAPAPASFRLTHEPAGAAATRLSIDAVDDSGNYVDGASYEAVLVSGSGRQLRADFAQTGPGKYEALVPSKESVFGKVYRMEEGRPSEEAFVHLPAGERREFQPVMNAPGFVAGTLRASVNDLVFRGGSTRLARPVENVLLPLALLLLVLDVALRKVDLRWLRRRRTVAVVEAIPSAPSHSALKARKQKVHHQPTTPVPLPETEPQAAPRKAAEQPPADGSDTLLQLKEARKRK
jgi:Ca-activated chloride channel family protein